MKDKKLLKSDTAETAQYTPDTLIKEIELSYDFIKHLTTISAGSILLIIGFLEKLFPVPQWKLFVIISLVAFALTILACMNAARLLAFNFAKFARKSQDNLTASLVTQFAISLWVAPSLFALGVWSMMIFAFKNLF
jgi:hypothetical protein